MKPRRPFWVAMLAALLPNPVFAIETGVNAMSAAQEFEQQPSIAAWAFNELREMVVGFRDMLDPILPSSPQSFNMLDAQIANFIAEGQIEQNRIQSIIESIDNQPESIEIPPQSDVTMIAEVMPTEQAAAFYGFDGADMTPKIEVFNDEGFILDVDTSKGIDLPDLTFDPRDGGTYTSEIPLVDSALEVVQLLQDQVPEPIQTTGTNLYNSVIGHKTDAEQ